MITQELLDEYRSEIRARVCSRCTERPPGGPPCGPLGKQCGVELHLEKLIDVAHVAPSGTMDPYVLHLRDDVCAFCPLQETKSCPCPLSYLLPLAIEAVEAVDQRREDLAEST